jgi:signal transduction histidine kinase
MNPSAKSPASDKRMVTLRSDILGGAFLIPLVLLVALGAITYFLARSTQTGQARRSLDTVATIQEERIDAYIESGDSNLSLIMSRSSLKTAIAYYEATNDDRFRSEAIKTLYDGVSATPDFTSVTIYDKYSNPLIYAGSTGARPVVPPEFVAAAAEGTAHGQVVDTAGDIPVNLIGMPITIDGTFVGVAVAGQSMETLYDLTSDTTGLGKTGETILVQEVDGEVAPISPLRFDVAGTDTEDTAILDGYLLERAVAGIESWSAKATDYHGARVFAYTRHIETAGWGMAVVQDFNEIMEPLNTQGIVLGAAVVLGIMIAFVAARRVADSVTAPLVRMAEKARKVASGRRDLTVETNLEEIADLVEAFNAMISELDSLTGDLEQKIEERTLELTEKNAQLRRVMDDKEVFLAGVSHELRSPLTAMIGFIDLVTSAGDALASEERSEMLETISFQATDVLNLIEDLLASARAEAGTLTMASVRVDLAAQARQIIEATNASSRSSVEFTGGVGHAVGDPARVRQIVRNLITNALRYGGEEIRLSVHTSGDISVLEVRDDGEGVPEEETDEIFEAYGQGEASKQVTDSVGLGLHVSRSLARLMGGDLDYEYRDGWSVFSLRLLQFTEDETDTPDDSSLVVSLGGGE